MNDLVIKSVARRVVRKFSGSLSGTAAVQLGAVTVRWAGINEAAVEECLTGCVLPAGLLQEAVAAVGLCRPDCRTAVALR
jgi:acetyl-CoA C-acetyltransferase